MKNFNPISIIKEIATTGLVLKGGSHLLFCLMLVNVYELLHHGQTALGLYMLMGGLLERCHHHGASSEAGEHVVHIVAHNSKGH